MNIQPLRRLTLSFLCLCSMAVNAQAPKPAAVPGVPPYPDRLQWWGEARFGLFIHWGPVSLKGTEIGWSRNPGPNGSTGGSIPAAEYEALYKQFNPTNFNARDWVAIAKAAGMKYLVFTTKHHDGFCEFDSRLTDYKITSPLSPFHRDVVKELADACHEAGLRFGMYYSQPDSHHPDYRTAHHSRYLEYMHGHLRELLSNYGRVDVIWFDGLGGTAQDWDAEKCIAMIKQLQPGILINNRCGLPADFDTPEQEIGKFQISRPWESCITICQQWAWKPNDEMKSPKQCLDTLIRCAGGDGNLLFNVGPMPDGRIEPRQVERLKEMGVWMAKYGETIYGTRGGPWKPSAALASTRKGKTVFVHLLRQTTGPVVLPNLPVKILNSSVLTGGRVTVQQTAEALTLSVPREDQQELDTIVALTVDAPALDIPPLSASLARSGMKATASNVYQGQEEFSAEKALDGDSATRWATDSGTHQAWLEADLGKPMGFSRVAVDEWAPGGQRVRRFELQTWNGTEWKTFYQGSTIGEKWQKVIKPITAQRVRLNILEATEGPTINEFTLEPK
jgi:alpha-L-fucosidase